MAQSKAYDSNAGQWPTFTGFDALTPNSTEIRVLRLLSDNDTGDLRYSLHCHDLENLPEWSYSALSYSWGAPVPLENQQQIFIEGQPVLIRPTLYWFLKTLAEYDAGANLWIDAVCINQADVEERNQQISMMGQIFQAAEKVYVWLGPGDDDTNYVFEHMRDKNPQTPFDHRQYNPCAEKLFKGSYWTRRWVLQEFALAKQLFICCGSNLISWEELTQKIDVTVLGNDKGALSTLNNFKQLRTLHTHRQTSLLQSMLDFRNARCIDRRDNAFALRGIATDGARLMPDYRESVVDVYFRLLSQLPTEKVLPEMLGYRWPHQAANQLLECFLLTKDDFLTSLNNKSSDKLFMSLEYIGEVTSVGGLDASAVSANRIELSRSRKTSLYGTARVGTGDLVYSLQFSSRSPKGVFVAFSPDLTVSMPTGFVFDDRAIDAYRTVWNTMEAVVSTGFERCSRNLFARSLKYRVLCHITRATFVWLWLLECRQVTEFRDYFEIGPASENRGATTDLLLTTGSLCQCSAEDNSSQPSQLGPEDEGRNRHVLEVLPAFESDGFDYAWWTMKFSISSPLDLEDANKVSQAPGENDSQNEPYVWQPEFQRHCRTDLSYAVEEGHLQWTERFLSSKLHLLNWSDEQGGTPISWAISGGQAETLRMLLATNRIERKWSESLRQAAESNFNEGVKLLLATEEVDPNNGGAYRTPLSYATIGGHLTVVETLLADDRIIPDKHDCDRKTPLLWAAKHGRLEIARLLLNTKKVDINLRDLSGMTPLATAVQSGSAEVVEALLAQEGIQPDILDNQRWDPLCWAAHGNNIKIGKLLFATGKWKDDERFWT